MTDTTTAPSSPLNEACYRAGITLANIAKRPTDTPKGEHHRFHWDITIGVRGRDFLTVPYSAGIGHAVDGNGDRVQINTARVYGDNIARQLVNTGNPVNMDTDRGIRVYWPTPTVADVMCCLLLDSSALDFPNLDAWASEYGYDADSRKAEGIYRACLEIALKLRAALGDTTLAELREVASRC